MMREFIPHIRSLPVFLGVSIICSSWSNKLNQLKAQWICLTSTTASQVDPSECRSRFTFPTQSKTLMKTYKVPLVPILELQPPAPKKHCRPFHQLQQWNKDIHLVTPNNRLYHQVIRRTIATTYFVPKSASEAFPLPGRMFTQNIRATQSSWYVDIQNMK